MDSESKIKELEAEIVSLKDRLSKYTQGKNHKRYYEKNKEKIMENSAKRLKNLKKTNPEKIKEYARRAYLKKKEKMMKEKEKGEDV